jgi:predicted transcriptional regulator
VPRDVMTLRLDRAFRSRLRVAAGRRRVTPSAAARLALEAWVEAEDRDAGARPFDAIADLVGSVRSSSRRAR